MTVESLSRGGALLRKEADLRSGEAGRLRVADTQVPFKVLRKDKSGTHLQFETGKQAVAEQILNGLASGAWARTLATTQVLTIMPTGAPFMHPQIRQHRENLSSSSIDSEAARVAIESLRVMHAVRGRAANIDALMPGGKIRSLIYRFETARETIERSDQRDILAASLLPSVKDTLVQLGAVLRQIRDELQTALALPAASTIPAPRTRDAV